MKKTKEDFLEIKTVEEYQAIQHCFSHLSVDEEIKAHISFLYKDMHSYLGDLETFEKVQPE